VFARASVIAAAILCAAPAFADFAKVEDERTFREIVAGKKLTRPLVELQVTQDGAIMGRGMTWDVTGNWTWKDGYFCRDLVWGGDALGYNCQEVRVNGGKIRFTSDRGAGDSADFRLR
jgi:hypothetical protein